MVKEPVHWYNTAVCTAADQLIETCLFLFLKESGQTGDLNSPILSDDSLNFIYRAEYIQFL